MAKTIVYVKHFGSDFLIYIIMARKNIVLIYFGSYRIDVNNMARQILYVKYFGSDCLYTS